MYLLENKTIFIIIAIACIYIGFAFYSDVTKTSEHFFNVDPTFLLIILPIEICAFFTRSIRQKILLDNIGIRISLLSNFKLFVAGLSMTITPGGSGNIIKSHFLKKFYDYPHSQTLPLVFVERFHDFLAVTTIISITLLFSYLWQSFVLVILSLLFLIIIFSIFKKPILLEKFLSKVKKIKFLSKYIPSLKFSESLVILTSWKITLKAWPISIVSWSLEIFSFYYIFKAFDINLNFIESAQIVYTSILVGALSFLPAGLGFTEGTLIALLLERGYELSVITAAVFMIRIVTVWFATGIGFIFAQNFLKINFPQEKY